MRYTSFFTVCLALFVSALASVSFAQSTIETVLPPPVYAVNATHIKHGNALYHLWGTRMPAAQAMHDESARYKALENLIGRSALTCFISRQADAASPGEAQCFNGQSVDLSQAMIKQGLALADRATLLGTNHESAYLNAEKTAQTMHAGLWRVDTSLLQSFDSLRGDLRTITVLAFAFFVVILIGIIVAAFLNHRSAERIYLALNQTIQLITKEAKIRQRELELVAVMIHAELRTNQSKIEAFLVIYEDLLKTLSDPYADHKYLRSGEIVRSAPALDRFIYDANVDKLDALGEDLIPRVVAFYGHAETDPPYNDLTMDMDHESAFKIVQNVVENARKLNADVNEIIELCDAKGFTSVNLMLAN